MSETKSPFVPIEALAQYFSVSVSTVRAWVRQGHIPENTYIKLGNTYRFDREKVAAALLTMRKDDMVAEEQAEEPAEAEDAHDPRQLEFDFNEDEDV